MLLSCRLQNTMFPRSSYVHLRKRRTLYGTNSTKPDAAIYQELLKVTKSLARRIICIGGNLENVVGDREPTTGLVIDSALWSAYFATTILPILSDPHPARIPRSVRDHYRPDQTSRCPGNYFSSELTDCKNYQYADRARCLALGVSGDEVGLEVLE